jgi:hypothetical protein
MKLFHLNRRYTERRPASSPETDSFITPRLIDIYEVVRLQTRGIVQVEISKVLVPLLSYLA